MAHLDDEIGPGQYDEHHGMEWEDFDFLCMSVETFPGGDRRNLNNARNRKCYNNIKRLVFRDWVKGLSKIEIIEKWRRFA